jgi:membrane fusion protein (multidrug efflux system)
MKTRKKPLILVLIVLGVLVGTGGTLYFTGNLPLKALQGGPALAATSDQAAAEATDDEAKETKEKPEVMPIPVEAAQVAARGIAAYYRAASVIEADRLVELPCRADGRVRTIAVEEGDWVKKDQILAELENDREKIQLRKAELTLADKQRQLDRSRRMQDEELISQQEFDDVESAFKLAEAERDLARIALEETRVRAPFAGRITDRKVVLGQQVALSVPAFTLGDFSPLRVRVHLPENVARKVDAGQRVLVSPEAVEQPLEALVERVSPVVDPATSTVRLTLLLDDQDSPARVGSFVKVRITTDQHHDALSIPKLALVEEGALRSVFVAEADTVRKVEVRTGLYDETHVEILEGLYAGDFVVTAGQGGLRTGTVVNVLNHEAVGYRGREEEDRDPAAEDVTQTAMVEK